MTTIGLIGSGNIGSTVAKDGASSAYVTPYAVPGTTYPDWSARPATADLLREALGAARRYRDM